MNKLIIDNRTQLTDFQAITLVGRVIKQGRISNNGRQYCYATQVTFENQDYMVYSGLNKNSDRFVITSAQGLGIIN